MTFNPRNGKTNLEITPPDGAALHVADAGCVRDLADARRVLCERAASSPVLLDALVCEVLRRCGVVVSVWSGDSLEVQAVLK